MLPWSFGGLWVDTDAIRPASTAEHRDLNPRSCWFVVCFCRVQLRSHIFYSAWKKGSWMSQRKMLQFSAGALLLLLPWFGGLVLGLVSNDFALCLQFFYDDTPPEGISGAEYQPICQHYKNDYRFASLYHRGHHTPFYSAYKLKPGKGERPDFWMYEPQLATSGAGSEMVPFPETGPVDQNVIDSQAVVADYKDTLYTYGHLNPNMHQETVEAREATFTLTNIVPQRGGSNFGPWSRLETEMLKRFQKYCNELMYVITGVVPFKPEPKWLKTEEKRVSVPEYLWSAYCCPSFKSDLPASVKDFFPTYAAVGRNHPNSAEDIVPVNARAKDDEKGYDVRQMSLETLEENLEKWMGVSITLFKGHCK